MRVTISDACIGCGLCVDTAPLIFCMDEKTGMAAVIRNPENSTEEDLTRRAVDGCPVGAIEIA